jgi:glycosyltransferase involved in cell wall biosynthesis
MSSHTSQPPQASGYNAISMAKRNVVYLCVWSGNAERARDLVSNRYPGIEIVEFPYRRLRASSFSERIGLLHGFRGRALVFYLQSLDELKYRQILECIHFLHRCRETVLCDSGARWETMRTVDILRSAPEVLLSILLDLKTVIFWWCYLHLRLMRAAAAPGDTGSGEIAYLIPSLASMGSSGGAISHIRGFLCGLKSSGRTCRVFSGTPLAQDAFENEIVAPRRRPYFFWEARVLSFNFVFARAVQGHLASSTPQFLYQRHCRLSIAGVLLSKSQKIPLILEYNGPEGWVADHWDPTLFRSLISLCEEVSLRCATRIIVVSEALRAELAERGIPADRIRVNPNAVDPDFFYPGPGREAGRRELHIEPDEVLIGFAGSFSLWHGIQILEQAIVRLLSNKPPCRLRFVLMGEGLLHGEMRSALAAYEKTGKVIFTGSLPRDKVAEYLDAADILVSPHIPMPDGSRFFGSPTKLFEYMAMGKSIVASRLEQLAEVLEHDRTAWLITPGDVDELAEAILRLALDPAKRAALGAAARHAAVERHSWAGNVSWALSDMPGDSPARRYSSMTLPSSTGNPG